MVVVEGAFIMLSSLGGLKIPPEIKNEMAIEIRFQEMFESEKKSIQGQSKKVMFISCYPVYKHAY